VVNSIFAQNKLVWAGSKSNASLMTRPTAAVANGFARLNVVVDWVRGEICHPGGRQCKLSARESALLACLARKAGTTVSRAEILSQVWKLDPTRTTTRTIDMHISHLRRKLAVDAHGPRVLITVRGVGYMLHRGAISSEDLHPSAGEGGPALCEATLGIESSL